MQSIVIHLNDMITFDDSLAITRLTGARSRRARDADGRRQRRRSRRWKAIQWERNGAMVALTETEKDHLRHIDHIPERGRGLWTIDVANANCWNTALRQILSRSQADAVLLQEVKRCTAADIQTAKASARSAGWRAFITPAFQTARRDMAPLEVLRHAQHLALG